jgi:hypothetical protein
MRFPRFALPGESDACLSCNFAQACPDTAEERMSRHWCIACSRSPAFLLHFSLSTGLLVHEGPCDPVGRPRHQHRPRSRSSSFFLIPRRLIVRLQTSSAAGSLRTSSTAPRNTTLAVASSTWCTTTTRRKRHTDGARRSRTCPGYAMRASTSFSTTMRCPVC